MEFEWNPHKAQINIKKHNISFAEATTVFNDPIAQTFDDPAHSIDEQRFITIGYSSNNKLIVLAHTDRGEKIRIISARKATPKERRFYERGNI